MGAFSSRVEAIAAEAEDIPTLHEVACKALKTISDEGSSSQDLQRVISRDQALTSRILRIANSTFLGISSPVRTLREAILVLGTRRLRSLVLAASLDGVVKSRALKNRHMWEHALAVALASGFLSRDCEVDPEKAFVCGLMHDVGKVVLDKALTEYQQVLDVVYNEKRPFLESEREILGFDHTQIGGLVARQWNLPADIQETIACHHDPAAAAGDSRLCAVVSLADGLCVKQGIGPSHRPDLNLASLPACDILDIEPDSLPGLMLTLNEHFQEDKRFFGLA